LDDPGDWEEDVPANLRPAVAYLRKSFDEAHWGCGETTRRFCYAALHEAPPDDPTREYFLYLMAMRRSDLLTRASENSSYHASGAGTIFRSDSPTGVSYDHTSVLATLRDWLGISVDKMLTNKRIAAAPISLSL
jgi:hypothetical protein